MKKITYSNGHSQKAEVKRDLTCTIHEQLTSPQIAVIQYYEVLKPGTIYYTRFQWDNNILMHNVSSYPHYNILPIGSAPKH